MGLMDKEMVGKNCVWLSEAELPLQKSLVKRCERPVDEPLHKAF